MKKKHFISFSIAFIITTIFACIVSYNIGKHYQLKEFQDYYDANEHLLNYINNHYDDFAYIIMESDAYYEYELAKDKLN